MNPSRSPEQAQSSFWRKQGVRILTSCPCAILESIIDGSLLWQVASKISAELAPFFDKDKPFERRHIWAQRDNSADDFVPSIYMPAFVEELRHGSNVEEIQTIVNLLRQYISGHAEYEGQNAATDNMSRGQQEREAFNVVCIFTLARYRSFSFLPACRRFPLTLPVTMGVH
jgi:hypothetical protein